MTRLDELLKQITDVKQPPIHLWHPDPIADIDMEIKRNGDWLHQGRVIQRQSMVKLFASILRNDDGRYYLVTPIEKCPVRVECTVFVIVSAELIDGRWFLTNNLHEAIELTDQKVIWQDEETPVINWRDQLSARINQSVMYQLQVYALDHNGLKKGQLWLKTGESQILLAEL